MALATTAGMLAFATGNCAAAQNEFWPEFDGFFTLNDRARIFAMGSLTRAEDADDREGSPRYENGQAGVSADISLRPLFRRKLDEDDWERNRYLWMRIGYNYVGNYRANGDTYHEDRGVLEFSLRQPATQDLTLTGRVHWDLRNIDGDYSNRYRVRTGLEWATEAGGYSLAPYAHVEVSYDTRFDAWNQQRYQAGVEVKLSASWRIEPYIARQDDSRSAPAHIDALGLILKYYR
jgi:Protein of unknown function (DUF2490)